MVRDGRWTKNTAGKDAQEHLLTVCLVEFPTQGDTAILKWGCHSL